MQRYDGRGYQRRGVVAHPRQRQVDGRRPRDVAEDDAAQRQRPRRLGHQGHTEAGRDEREQDRGVGGLVLAARREAGGAGAALDRVVDGRVRVGIHHERLVGDVGDLEPGLLGEPVVGGQREHQLLAEHDPQLDVVARHGRPQQPEVDVARAQRVELGRRELVGHHLQRDARQVLLHDAGDARQLVEGGRAGEGDAQQARAALGDAAYAAHGVLEAVDHSLGLGAEERPGRGQADLAGGAGEQGRTELGLELPDRVGQGGLGDVQLLGGATEVTGLGDGEEVTQVAQLHVATSSLLWPRAECDAVSRRNVTSATLGARLMNHKDAFTRD